MEYRVKKTINLNPVFNIHWLIDSAVNEILIDRYFSKHTKENLILQGYLEPIEEKQKPMTAEQFIETYHPERWWKWISAEKHKCEDVLNKPHVLELLKRYAKIVRKQERESILDVIKLTKQAERENK